ncbi:MAG: radical SAM protein [Candidatus Omnitrophota bacterium]
MSSDSYQYIYGPVHSWRLGVSLGIDPLSTQDKCCNFNCRYCQLGPTLNCYCNREVFVPAEKIVAEIRSLPAALKLDVITFSGRGEPTLAKNLGDIIRAVKEVRPEPIAVITNAVLMNRVDVQDDLLPADLILAKLDAFDQTSLQNMNAPAPGVKFAAILAGIKEFRGKYAHKLALQIMFTDHNKSQAAQIADVVRDIGADEIELNTPLRPNPCRPLSPEELSAIKHIFSRCSPAVKTVYELRQKPVPPLNKEDTVKRHGTYTVEPRGRPE